jgi:predicted metalloprotease with PDZ domain
MGVQVPWRRGNGPGAYTDGVRLLCVLDGALRARGEGLDTLLRALLVTFGGRHISTAQFEAVVARLLPEDRGWLESTFRRALHAGA